eukprot:1161744-Pelagomonas_calceolata.AAC.2
MGACVQLECFACSSGSCPSSGQGAVHAVHAVLRCSSLHQVTSSTAWQDTSIPKNSAKRASVPPPRSNAGSKHACLHLNPRSLLEAWKRGGPGLQGCKRCAPACCVLFASPPQYFTAKEM